MLKHFSLRSLVFVFCLTSIFAPSQSTAPSVQSDLELFPVAVRRKVGYIDVRGKLVIPMKFRGGDINGNLDDGRYFKDGLAIAFTDDGHGGFIDKTGRFVISGPYYPLAHFSEDLARVMDSKGQTGFIDRTGRLVIPAQFRQAEDFSDGLAMVQVGANWGYIDKTGRMVISARFDEAQSFVDGFANVRLYDLRRGYINHAGKFIPMPDETVLWGRPSEGLIAVKIEGKWGFVNMQGEMVIAPQFEPEIDNEGRDRYTWGAEFKDGRAPAQIKGKYGFIDKTGKFLIAPKFDEVLPFQGNVARVKVGGKWGLINLSGDYLANPQFKKIELFYEDRAAVTVDEVKFGYIDPNGKLVIPLQFNEAREFSEGLACVKKELRVNGKLDWFFGYIDKSGTFVIKPQFTYPGRFWHGLAHQLIFEYFGHTLDSPGHHNEWGYIDRTGKWVWRSTD
jgi:WG containing repeat